MEYNPAEGSPGRQATVPGSPKVSIGMPVYNGEAYLRKALDSLLAQRFSDFELIVSDNASTDRTQEICYEYASKDARIRYIRQMENKGVVWNFKFVLEQAHAQYFMWAAADDKWEQDYISTLVHRLENNSDVVIAFSGYDVICINGNEEKVTIINDYMENIPSNNLFGRLRNFILYPDQLGKVNIIYGLMRRDILGCAWSQTIGSLDWQENLWGQDALLVFKILTLGNLSFEPKILFHKYEYHIAKSPILLNKNNLTNYKKFPMVISDIINYFSGLRQYVNRYMKLLDNINNLTMTEKKSLKKLVIKRKRFLSIYFLRLILKRFSKKLFVVKTIN